MKYLITGNPNEKVRRVIEKKFGGFAKNRRKQFNSYAKGRILFVFNEKGQYITDNERLVKKLKYRYECTPIEEENIIINEEIKHKCKKCSYTTNNKGELLAHYRKEHPKE